MACNKECNSISIIILKLLQHEAASVIVKFVSFNYNITDKTMREEAAWRR